MTTIVNGLETEYDGKLECDVLDATTADSKTAIAEHGFDNHGLLVYDDQDHIHWKKNGHEITEVEIRTAVDGAMTAHAN